jgi:hypothetical protein
VRSSRAFTITSIAPVDCLFPLRAVEQLASPSHDVVLWLSGYYNGKRNNTIIEPLTINKNEEKINSYCYQHRETTVMDAVKNVLGFDK